MQACINNRIDLLAALMYRGDVDDRFLFKDYHSPSDMPENTGNGKHARAHAL